MYFNLLFCLFSVSSIVVLLSLLFLRRHGQTYLFHLRDIPDFPLCADDRDHGGSSQPVVRHQWDH